MSRPSVGVVILTLNSREHLAHCLPSYLESRERPRVLVVDSSSNDGSAQKAESLGAEVIVIPRQSFNHGLTREYARKHLGTDIVVMATPDAYPKDHTLIENLVAPIRYGDASIAYARQLPHRKAGFFESFAREYNYPSESHIRGIEDRARYGTYTFFCSNSCAAYCNRALDAIGGFKSVLLGEDTVAAAQLLHEGHKIAYVAEAEVYHSHGYTLWQEFQRYFDTGLAREEYRELIASYADDSKRGRGYVSAMTARLLKEKPHLLPYGALQTLVKWTGFQIGKRSIEAPAWFKKMLSGHKAYWA